MSTNRSPSPSRRKKSPAFNLYLTPEREALLKEAEAWGAKQELRMKVSDVVELALKRLLRGSSDHAYQA